MAAAPPLALVAVLLVAMSSAGSASASEYEYSASGGLIAFTSMRDGDAEIYVMNADGSSQTKLTNNSGVSDAYPSWSPDGSKIAFTSNRDGNFEVYVMNADGSGQTRLTTNGANDGYQAWSPDGSKIAFNSSRDGNGEIYVMNADGSGQTRLTNNGAHDMFQSWSPDGSKIAFTSDRDGGDAEIYVMNADGSGPTRITNVVGDDYLPAWSPDGSKIAFTSVRDGNPEIYVMSADGSSQTRLTNNSDLDDFPAWSPDSSKLAYTSYRADNYDIYVMNTDGSGQTKLTSSSAVDYMPSWSPASVDPLPPVTVMENPFSYYFPWYDNTSPGMEGAWITVQNEGGETANVEIYVGNNPSPRATFSVEPYDVTPWIAPYPLMGGPVRVVSTNEQPLVVSQRVHYRGSFNEVWGVDDADLGTDFYFPWYDFKSPGFTGDWLLVSNIDDDNQDSARVEIRIGGLLMENPDHPGSFFFDVAPGGKVTPLFNRVMNGPVRITCINCDSGQRLLTSQRVHFYNSFTEMMGIPASKAVSQAMFTWCDDVPTHGFNEDWLLVVNTGNTTTNASIKVGQNTVGTINNIPAGKVGTWRVPNSMMGGPVVVSADQPIIVSQRIHYKSSFEEVPGTNPDDLSNGALFNWYDSRLDQGWYNWVLMGNLNNYAVDSFLFIGPYMITDNEDNPIHKIPANQNITPLIPGLMGGPVLTGCVDCQAGDRLIFSQRVHYRDSFNELVGKPRAYNLPRSWFEE